MAASSSSSDANSIYSTRVSAAQLRAWAPFVRKDAIKAGDVVLSRGSGLELSVIAGITGGHYSHAAIFLPFRLKEQLIPLRIDPADARNVKVDYIEKSMQKYGSVRVEGGVHLDLVEADDYGVGAVPPRTLTIAFGGRRYHVIRLAGDPPPKLAVLLRHPDVSAVHERLIEQAVRTFSDTELLRRYSSMDRLVGPLTLPQPVKDLLKRLLRWKYPQPGRLVLPGCFCSELVVKFFDDLGIRSFREGVPPEQVSPNHLAPERRLSLLKPVPDAVVAAADIPDDAYGDVVGVLQMDLRAGGPVRKWSCMPRHKPRHSYLLSLVELREERELFIPESKAKLDEIVAETNSLEEMLRAIELNKNLVHDVAGLVLQRQILDAFLDESLPTTLRSKLDFLFVITVFLGLLRDRLRRTRFPLEAVFMLRLFHDQLVADVLYRHARMQTLARMFRARRSPAATSRQERMNALAGWRSGKARRAQEMAVLDRPIRRRIVPNGPPDAETQALVTKVLAELTDETSAKLHLD